MTVLSSPVVHPWLRRGLWVAFVPGLSTTALLEEVVEHLLEPIPAPWGPGPADPRRRYRPDPDDGPLRGTHRMAGIPAPHGPPTLPPLPDAHYRHPGPRDQAGIPSPLGPFPIRPFPAIAEPGGLHLPRTGTGGVAGTGGAGAARRPAPGAGADGPGPGQVPADSALCGGSSSGGRLRV